MKNISIIVPVYNIAPYLERCIDSVLVQTYSYWELILVDDGSEDGSGEICDSFTAIDPRISVIHQDNMGAAGARNTGIEIAIQRNSDYLCFLDGDDWWHPLFLEKMHASMERDDTLMAVCGFYRVEPDEYIDQSYYYSQLVSERITVLSVDECYKNSKIIGTGPCNKLFASSLLYNNRFPVGRLYEDEFFTYKLIYYAGKISLLDAKMYYYYQRPDSSMHSPLTVKGIGDKLDALYERALFFIEHGEEEFAKTARENALVANAKSVILAIEHGRYSDSEFPKRYKMSKWKALYYVHKFCDNNNYSYFLNKLYPRGIMIHLYLKKIREVAKSIYVNKP